jgi:hypothetical protein
MPVTRLGGSFAPPFTDELLETYRKLFAELPTSPVKDAIKYVSPAPEKWWELPAAVGTSTRPHPARTGVVIVDLQDDHKEILDPLIPWAHELDAIGGAKDKLGLFDSVEADVAERNAPKAQRWVQRVYDAVIREYFPKNPDRYAALWEAHRTAEKWLPFVGAKERERFETDMTKAQKCSDAIRAAVSAKEHPEVPRPEFDPTPVRDAAFHVLWHTRELDLGREPITTDKLPPI